MFMNIKLITVLTQYKPVLRFFLFTLNISSNFSKGDLAEIGYDNQGIEKFQTKLIEKFKINKPE